MIIKRSSAAWALAVLAFTVFLNSVDQLVPSAVAGQIQSEMRLSDAQVGMMFGAFVVALALSAVPLGFLADRHRRTLIIASGVAVWSLATALGGLARGFGQLLAARTLVGVGEASSQPAGTSLVGDLFDQRSRGRAMAVLIAAAGLGTGVGLILGGVIGFRFGWRAAFFVAGAPGLLAALLALTIHEPPRGAAEHRAAEAGAVRETNATTYRRLLANRTFVLVFISGTVGLFSQGSSQLIVLYLNRRFGLDVQQASALTGSPLLIGGVIGTPIYGWLLDLRSRHSARGPVEMTLIALVLCAIASIVMFGAPYVGVFTAGAIVFGIAQWAFIMPPFVIVQNVVAPHRRAQATALTVTGGRLFGSALGPFAVGVLSDALGHNLGLSLLILQPAALLISAAVLALAFRSITSDGRLMQAEWASLSAPATDALVAV